MGLLLFFSKLGEFVAENSLSLSSEGGITIETDLGEGGEYGFTIW